MGFFSTSFGFSRYEAKAGDVGAAFYDHAVAKLKERRFASSVAGAGEVAAGWTAAREPYSSRLEYEEVVFGDYLLFALMMEVRRVPPALLKKHVALEERKVLEESGRKRLGQKARKELRDKVRLALLAKVLPVPAVHDVVWNVSSGALLFFSCQDRAIQKFEELFHETFGLRPVPVSPYHLARGYCEEKGCLDGLSRAVPEVMV